MKLKLPVALQIVAFKISKSFSDKKKEKNEEKKKKKIIRMIPNRMNEWIPGAKFNGAFIRSIFQKRRRHIW